MNEYSTKEAALSQPKVVIAGIDGRDIEDGQGRAFKPDCGIDDIEFCHAVLIPGFVPCINERLM